MSYNANREFIRDAVKLDRVHPHDHQECQTCGQPTYTGELAHYAFGYEEGPFCTRGCANEYVVKTLEGS